MKLTKKKHVSEFALNMLIDHFDCWNQPDSPWPLDKWILAALLELKHRRAEDRKREHDNAKA